jgi:hypothetical protein
MAEQTKPKSLEELTRQVVRGEGPFAAPAAADGTRAVPTETGREAALAVMAAPPNPETSVDVFDRPLGRLVGEAGLRAQATHSNDPMARKDAQFALAERKAKARAAAPARPGQRPSVAQWTSHVRERLSRMTEKQRNELIWNSEWYDGLSERAAAIVDDLLLEFGEEEIRTDAMAEYARSDLTAESEATARLNAELDADFGFDADEDLDLEAEAAMFDFDAEVDAGLDAA